MVGHEKKLRAGRTIEFGGPGAAAEAPSGYIRQLALYRAVLQKLYPQRPVRAALLWTETPEMMEISAPALDAGLASILRGDVRA